MLTKFLKMKGNDSQLERLGYMLPQDISVEIHAMLIEYEKGLPKKAETPQVMMIKSGKIQKANNKSLFKSARKRLMARKMIKRFNIPKPNNPKSTAKERPAQMIPATKLLRRKSFPHRPERATDLLGIIHTDVCGPLRHVSRQGASYFITFTDDYSRYGYVYLLKHKHEVFETFKVFKNEVENQLGKTIKAIRSDRGGEYISQEFKDYLKANGIVQQLTPPYTPQHNGVSERRNRTLLDMVRSMMNLTTLPLSFWDYALESATRILNMVPTKKVDKTPYELWYGKVPNLSYLKVWGCEALVKRDTPDKLEQRSVKCIFIGYPKETMGYYFYFPPENKIVVARYAEFFEKRLISQEISGRAVDLEEIQEEEDTTPSEITSNIPQEVEEAEEHSLRDLNEPASYKAAMLDSESNNQTVYTQLYGVDYEETFSPVADIRAIRILISIAAFYDYEICQMGVKIAFLNGYLEEYIYMVQPEGFVDPNHPRKVCIAFKDPFMVLSKHQEAGIKDLMRKSKNNHHEKSHSKFTKCKDYLGKCFAMKGLGEAAFILGIKIYKDMSKRLIGLGQNAYMDKILKRYKLDNSKHGHIPMQERLDLNKTQTPEEVKHMKNIPYTSAVGSIMYAVRCTRPHVANTKDMFLVYGGNSEAELRVDCYCDAEFETDRDDIKSRTGYVFILNGGAVNWKNSKQSTTAMSATEAEYIAASEAAMKAVWIRKFISGLEMAQPDNNNTLSSAFKTFFEREKLTGDNFNDWYRSLRIVLRVAGTYDYLFKPCPDEPPEDAAENVKAAWKAEYKIHYDVACLMLRRMSPALQRQIKLYFPQAMLYELRRMFEMPKAVEIYDLVDTLHSCKQAPGKSVSAHVLEMKGYMDQLQALGKPYDNDMAINLINRSLNKDFGDFVRNFNMHCVGKTVSDLHALLIDYEKGLKDKAPTPQVLAIQKGRVNKPKPQANKKGKSKGKADKNKQVVAYQPKPKQNPPQKKENPKKDQACHYCNVVGHWKRNCPLYLEELRTNKNKKAEHGAATSAQAALEAIGVFNLVLPSGLVLSLNNCHYAPSIIRGVVSFSCLLDLGFVHTVTSNGISVSLNGIFYFSAISVNGVFEIDMNNNVSKNNNNSIFSINKKRKLDLNSSYLWHCRLAHIGKTRMQKLQREGLLESINDDSYDKCESCISGKMTKKPFNNNIERATDLLGLIHTDVCGPFRHVSRKGASYFLTFTDDFSRYGYVYLLKHKHEVFETFKVFKAEVELQLGKKIKALRSDRGGEYLSQEFKDYLGKNGIVQHLTSPYTPQENGVSERKNRTLLDMVRSMFNLTTLPLSFWDYALESAVRILNMVPTKKVDKTPYEIWHGKVPNLSYLKVWGCEAYVKRDPADKLQQRSVKCIFVGYPKETMGYYFYFPTENKVIVATYGDFLERDLISQEFSGRDYDLEDDHMDTLPSKNTSEIPVEPESLGPPPELIPVRRSERPKNAPNRLCLNMEVEDDEVGDLGEPANYRAAMIDPDKVLWQGAMDEEMKSMKVNKVWIVVDRPPNAKVVRSKWLYKKKTDMDGKVHTYKARLVAKGCTQTYGIDYEETFSPVADIRAIRILIAIAAYYDYEIWQMDVKTAFLNGRLDEDIYMEQPEGYVDPKFPNGVCKLQRAIYGLKQASRQWNKRFDEEIKRFGFIQNRDEPCVYRKASGSDVVFLILYVDDILIMGNNIPKLKEVKDYLGKCFSVKDLGEAAYILGIKIYRDRSLRLIGLNQSAYIDKILKKFNMQNSKKGFIPMEVKHDLSNEMCASSDEEKAYMKKVPYASAVGSIMYAVRCTRPDVAFAQNLVSRYQQNPGKLHWVAVKHILKYLRNTKDMFLVYGGIPDTELDVTGFCDASWQCDKDDTKSQTGYVFVINGGAVDWKSKKQTTIAMHATQSEYMAASEAAMEAVWIRKFVEDLGVMPSISKPINMYCDNSAAIIFANEPGVMKGARHFLRRYHYVREQVESGEIKLIKVHTDKNLADAFTKALPRGKVSEHANGIGLRLASSFMHICD
ncbi:putative RNA-directed DNA polymerase [Tanacetum coccineum]